MPSIIQPTLFDVPDVPPFLRPVAITEAIEALSTNSGIEERGAIFTRIEVVHFILDLVGYVVSEPLHRRRILEPSFGRGDFLIPLVERLLIAWREQGGNISAAAEELGSAVRGVELHRESFSLTREAVVSRLKKGGVSASAASELASQWLKQGDFLLEQQHARFDYVVGNPPYVRQELIPGPLLSEYRRRYSTMYDRADLYIPFIEHSLSLLDTGGTLGFICSDRWMKNRYGGPLREYVARNFHLKAYVDMVDTDAFHSEVSAYPAITIISRTKSAVTRIAHRPRIGGGSLAAISSAMNAKALAPDSDVREVTGIGVGCQPWLLDSSDLTSLVRRIEGQFPTLEQAGCKVGIGVATGADQAFIGDFETLDVEPDRKVPLVTTRDIQTGVVAWRGQGVINPFAKDGSLVDLRAYPRLASYLEARKTIIGKRHCARKAPANWYRTIDRIWPALTCKPKLLIPDIKGQAHIVFEPGRFYPHHNLYYVVSDTWDLRALQAVLLSGIAKLFITTYSTKIRGGYLRFQAQYLRRIRIPLWSDVPESLRRELVHAASNRELDACNEAACTLFKLNQKERAVLANGE